jgi:hypothetical protein
VLANVPAGITAGSGIEAMQIIALTEFVQAIDPPQFLSFNIPPGAFTKDSGLFNYDNWIHFPLPFCK